MESSVSKDIRYITRTKKENFAQACTLYKSTQQHTLSLSSKCKQQHTLSLSPSHKHTYVGTKEMNNRIGAIVKHEWNVTMHVLKQIFGTL